MRVSFLNSSRLGLYSVYWRWWVYHSETIVFSPVVSESQTNELFSSLREHYEYIRKNSKKPGKFQQV
ncbi:hypothetical protein SX4_1823 [Vibrio mimicus SX-4]|nr:hypothetical protein SX4_1823 [Vibrio mimicus SX-4]